MTVELGAFRVGSTAYVAFETTAEAPDGTPFGFHIGDTVTICGVLDGPAERGYLEDHGAWEHVNHETHGKPVVMARAPDREWHWYFPPDHLMPADEQPYRPHRELPNP